MCVQRFLAFVAIVRSLTTSSAIVIIVRKKICENFSIRTTSFAREKISSLKNF